MLKQSLNGNRFGTLSKEDMFTLNYSTRKWQDVRDIFKPVKANVLERLIRIRNVAQKFPIAPNRLRPALDTSWNIKIRGP